MSYAINENDDELYGRIMKGAGEKTRLAGDASTRIYYRVNAENKNFILCHDHLFSEYPGTEYPFLTTQRLLDEAGIPVPAILACDKTKGLLVLQDLGDDLLEYHIRDKNISTVIPIYRLCIDLLVGLQGIRGNGETPFTLAFDRAKLMYEFNFFIENTLECYFRCGLSPEMKAGLTAAFEDIAALLDRPEHFVLNHRDFHARNIMVHRGGLYLIDFQDARLGLPQYDLVSLLCDPYVRIPGHAAAVLKEYYFSRAVEKGITAMGREEFDYFYDLMAFQRLVKAAGSYGYLTAVKKKYEFERYIVPALESAGMIALRRPALLPSWRIIAGLTGLEAMDPGEGVRA
ncbi:MAG: aminoglycoside phosphotransferase [Spirochaetae bacterium HGW-Spirochaetae-1]|jgi:hypothetical protein|nr:MAG: aminoglycoside phosphotransferase [Spirochaetae bacterium HGW-Spirochaetae-1]